ncbi:ATP-binding protein [Mucilaginibacter lutimaris]|uniref:histidine kinase n=1 Tax=Mucilaginibacter lutimaris TaxID=931629 RepID=A0ABW2ZEI1_9SPHI
MTPTETAKILATFPALAQVPEEQLIWLAANSRPKHMEAGEMLSSPEFPLTGSHFIMTGRFSVYNYQGGIRRDLGALQTGEITGALPFSRGDKTTVYIAAANPAMVITLPIGLISIMIVEHYELTQALVHVMCNRIRYMTSIQLQNEKMMALGKLSAGITHEINNPVAANISDADSLIRFLGEVNRSVKLLPSTQLTAQAAAAFDLVDRIGDHNGHSAFLPFKERIQKEDELTKWLEENNVNNADDLADILVDLNIDHKTLDNFKTHYTNEQLASFLRWMAELLRARQTAQNLLSSSKRIEELIRSVKTFTHMDRGADRQTADIHHGISNALTLLAHKRKNLNIGLEENFYPGLPEIPILIGELNQVWTNMIDNALDAMENDGGGTLSLSTGLADGNIVVTIADTGPGIPQTIQPFIFDPFFTTKEIGKGTGIGLEVVRTIVAQHFGSVSVTSRPGKTLFTVSLPVQTPD